MNKDWSLNALLVHCDTLIDSDPDHKSKYRSWKTACKSVISMQPNAIQSDVRKLDTKTAVQIYAGEHNPKPKTAREYRGRISAAIRSFTESMAAPDTVSSTKETPNANPSQSERERQDLSTRRSKVMPQTASNTLTIAIREDFLTQLTLPYDITLAEARRLCKLIEALPIEQDEETAH